MNNILTILIVFLPIWLLGQESTESEPWNIGCDTMHSQLEMNVCSYESLNIADSILTDLYDNLTETLDTKFDSEKRLLSAPNDTIQLEYINLIARQLVNLRQSREDFYKFRESSASVIELQYSGGSMQPLATNNHMLLITINQIEIMRLTNEELNF